MKRLLFLLALIIAMTIGSHGEAFGGNSQRNQQREDKLLKIEHKNDTHEAILNDATSLLQVCNGRPHRILPMWSLSNPHNSSKLSNHHYFLQPFFYRFHGRARCETAPFHFDVASKYYVICLRHLLC